MLNLHRNRRLTRDLKMNESDIAKELEEIKERLDKIETFFAHDGFWMMLNEKLASNFGHMTEILIKRMDELKEEIRRSKK
jgi:hypothetical protein